MRNKTLPALLASSALALGALAGCTASIPSVTPGGAAAGTPTPAPATSKPSTGIGTSAPPAARKGCPANDATIPSKASISKTADLDGDGRADTLFLAQDKETLGVRTASGATISTKFQVNEASDVGADGFVTGDGSAVILLGGSRTVYLFAMKNCHIVETHNAQGVQYTFDNGFRVPGTGVGCYTTGRGLTLAGLKAVPTSGGYTVQRTAIVLQHGGLSAANGAITTSGHYLSEVQAYDAVRKQFSCAPATS